MENVLSGYFIYAKSQTISPTASHSYARSGTAFMFILCRAAKNEPKKRAKTFPLGTPSRAALQSGIGRKT